MLLARRNPLSSGIQIREQIRRGSQWIEMRREMSAPAAGCDKAINGSLDAGGPVNDVHFWSRTLCDGCGNLFDGVISAVPRHRGRMATVDLSQ
jgi:hypothetical protein